jgi:hypothetical protein
MSPQPRLLMSLLTLCRTLSEPSKRCQGDWLVGSTLVAGTRIPAGRIDRVDL